MTDTLTAEALAAIYEPAFAAARERPRGFQLFGSAEAWLSFIRDDEMIGGILPWWGEEHPGRRPQGLPCDLTHAANACRCWAEDWLHDRDIHVEPYGRNEFRVLQSGVEDPDIYAVHRTIHHALSAAVVAVTGANTKEKA